MLRGRTVVPPALFGCGLELEVELQLRPAFPEKQDQQQHRENHIRYPLSTPVDCRPRPLWRGFAFLEPGPVRSGPLHANGDSAKAEQLWSNGGRA